MSYDEKTAGRVREILGRRADVVERRMFGGLCFMANGAMCCGLSGETLMVRIGPEQHEEALAQPHARPMDFTGKPMKGFVYVDAPGISTAAALTKWIDRSLAFVSTVPKKKSAKKPRPPVRRKRARP
jgi:TfoX/Sxy family transcriptional regulator of competence genes